MEKQPNYEEAPPITDPEMFNGVSSAIQWKAHETDQEPPVVLPEEGPAFIEERANRHEDDSTNPFSDEKYHGGKNR